MTVTGVHPDRRGRRAGRRAIDAGSVLLLAALVGLAGCASAGPPSRSAGASPPPGPSPSAVTTQPPTATVAPSPEVPGAPDRPTGPTERATLTWVVDGDTIRVLVGGREERVRYIGIDTPEPYPRSAATPQPFALAATEANRRLLAGGDLVLEKDVSERDRYGRLLRHVWIERDGAWTLLNLRLVADGFARVTTYPPDVKYVDALLAAQRTAREDGRGLWGESTP